MLNNALDASAKKAPIILKSTKTVTTTKTTQHICLGENGKNYEIGLNDLQSFLDEAPKKQGGKMNHTPAQRITSKRRISNRRNGESHKLKKKSRPSSVKAKAQHWNESDTDATDDESGRRGLICSNEKENDEIFTSTINTSGQSMNAGTNEFWKENTTPKFQPTSVAPVERGRKTAKRQNHSNEQEISEKKLQRDTNDINDIMQEPLSLPLDANVSNPQRLPMPNTSPRKLSAIFETSAEANASVLTNSPSLTLYKSPVIEKMVSNHYKQILNTTPPNISINDLNTFAPLEKDVVPRRTTRVFPTKLIRANLYPAEEDEVNDTASDILAPSKRNSRKNIEKSTGLRSIVENDGIAVPLDFSKSKARRNTKKATKSQELVEDDGIAVQSTQIEITTIDPPPADVGKSKARNTDKSKKTLELVEEKLPVETSLKEIATIAIDSPPGDVPKSKVRRNTKKSTKSQQLVEAHDIAVQSTQNEFASIAINSPPADVPKSKERRNTKKKSKAQHHVEDIIIVSAASRDLSANPAEAEKPKSRRNTKKRVKTNLYSIEENEAVRGNQNTDSEQYLTSPVASNISNKTAKTQQNHDRKAIKTNWNPPDEIATAFLNPDQNTKSTRTISKSNRPSKSSSIQAEDQSKNISKIVAVNPNGDKQMEDKLENSSSSSRKKNIDSKSNALQPKIPDEIMTKPAKKNTRKAKRPLNEQSSAEPSNESILFEVPEHDVERVETDQFNQSNMTTASTSLRGNSRRLIIYSPSRDRKAVKFVDENRVIISKSMVAKAIGNPNSGVLKGMSDSGMIIDANERLMYSPREGQDINLRKEVKKGVDILEILARRRQSVFILSQQWDD